MSTNTLTAGIIGLGPIGSILAVHLTEGGARVVGCDLPWRIDQIVDNVIHVQWHERHLVQNIELVSSIPLLADEKPDCVFICTKASILKYLMPEIVESFPPDTLIISAQNGIDPEGEIAKYVSPDYVTRMVINFAGHLEENGTAIVNFFNPPNSFGQLTEKDHPVVGKITRALNSVDLTSEIVDTFTMKKKAWTKTILNASVMPVCGMMRLTLSEVMSCAVTRKITGELVHEGINVGNKVGFGFTDDMYDTCMYYLDLGGDHHPSMTKDLIEKKPTEIEFINGKILEHGLKYDDVSVQVTRIMVMFIMTQEVVNGTRKPDEFPDYIMNN